MFPGKWRVAVPAIVILFISLYYFLRLTTNRVLSSVNHEICESVPVQKFYDKNGKLFYTHAIKQNICRPVNIETVKKFIVTLHEKPSAKLMPKIREKNALLLQRKYFTHDWHILGILRKRFIQAYLKKQSPEYNLTYYMNHAHLRGNIFGYSMFRKVVQNIDNNAFHNQNLVKFLAYTGVILPEKKAMSSAERLKLDISLHLAQKRLQESKMYTGSGFIGWIKGTLKEKVQESGKLSTLHIYTSYDPVVQKTALKYLDAYFKEWKEQSAGRKAMLSGLPPLETSVLIAKPETGQVVAMIGGMHADDVYYNTAVSTRRQVSSTIKPFIYGYALENNMFHVADKFQDKRITVLDEKGQSWEPANYYKYFQGDITFKNALVRSVNTVTVQIAEKIGRKNLASFFREVFLPENKDSIARIPGVASQALGSLDFSVLELSRGYQMLANTGIAKNLHGILSIKNDNGETIYIHSENNAIKSKRFFSTETTAIITDMLQDVVREGTASSFNKKKKHDHFAGKTGSSRADSWFAGYSPEYVMTVWAGFQEPEAGRVFNLPAFSVVPYWFRVMREIHFSIRPFRVPQKLHSIEFCPSTGCIGKSSCIKTRGLFRKKPELPICKDQVFNMNQK